MSQYVITISRQFASMGRTIAEKTAEKLGIEYLDRDIVELAAKRMNKPIAYISDIEEKASPLHFKKNSLFDMGIYSISNEVFYVQENIIKDYASKQSCIIVGRCSDYILRDTPNHLNVYIYAPYEARLKNCIEKLGMDKKTAIKMIKQVDDARANYQHKYCPKATSIFDNKDIMIDSSKFGIEGTAEILYNLVQNQFGV